MFVYCWCMLADMSLSEKLIDAATLAIVGMGSVIVSLSLIGGVFAFLRSLFTPDTPDEVPAPVAEVKSSGIDAHLVPIIIAAATAIVGRRVTVHRITFINSNTVSGWAEAGRTSIHQSHNLRRNAR